MKTSNSSAPQTGLAFGGLISLLVAVGAGSAIAQTFEYGGSTATIEQSGGGLSRSEVTRHMDGQKIVTEDGNSTDITIQRPSRYPAPDYGWGNTEGGHHRFYRQGIEDRFSGGTSDYSGLVSPGEREAFKLRMLQRMRSRSWP